MAEEVDPAGPAQGWGREEGPLKVPSSFTFYRLIKSGSISIPDFSLALPSLAVECGHI